MAKSVKKNYIYNMVFQILRVIAPLLVTPYVSRVLSSESIGTYGFTISIVTYFILIGSLGIDLYGQREIAFARDDIKKRSEIFWSLFLLKFITMSISAIVFFFVFAREGDYAFYYRILLFEMLANFLDISWLFQGLEDFKKITIRNVIVKVASIAATFLFVKTPDDLWIYLLVYCMTTLLGSLTLWPSLKEHIKKPERINIKPHLKPVLVLFLPQIAVQVYTVLDKSMLGWLSDMDQVGFYEQVQKVVKVFLAFITALGTVMMPHIASCYAAGETQKIKEYMKKTFSFVFFAACPISAGVIVVAPRFVPLFFGPGYEGAISIMQIISVIVLLIGLSNVAGMQFLLPTKRQKEFTLSIIAGTVTNVVFNLLLIPLMQGNGAAVATVIAEFAVTAVQFIFIHRSLPLYEIMHSEIKYVILSVIMAGICLGVDRFLPGGWTGLAIEALIGVATYCCLLVITKDKLLLEFKKK